MLHSELTALVSSGSIEISRYFEIQQILMREKREAYPLRTIICLSFRPQFIDIGRLTTSLLPRLLHTVSCHFASQLSSKLLASQILTSSMKFLTLKCMEHVTKRVRQTSPSLPPKIVGQIATTDRLPGFADVRALMYWGCGLFKSC